MIPLMDAAQALSFVIAHGIVMVSAKGPVPPLTEAIVGQPIRGSWWSHPQSHHIFSVLKAVMDSPDILVCRLVDKHVTLVHRRLWPALVKLAAEFEPDQLAWVRQEHTRSGKHVSRSLAYPMWVPREVIGAAGLLSESDARAQLRPILDR